MTESSAAGVPSIAEIKSPTADPVLRFIGDGLIALGKTYPFEGIGSRIQNVPDKDYGAWVAEFYKAVAISGHPRYDVVTASIQHPNDEPEQVIRYERLLLPWKARSGEVLVSLVSNRVCDNSGTEFATLVAEPERKLVKSS